MQVGVCLAAQWVCHVLPNNILALNILKIGGLMSQAAMKLLPFWPRSSEVFSHLSTSPRNAQEGTNSCIHCNQGFSNTIEASKIYSAFQCECFGPYLCL